MTLNEKNISIGLLFTLLFFNLVFDPRLAAIFSSMVIIIFFIIIVDKKRDFYLESKQDRLKSLTYGIVGYIISILASMGYFLISKSKDLISDYSFGSVANAFAQQQSILMAEYSPVLADNVLLIVLSFAFLIPFIETWLEAMAYDFLSDILPGFEKISLTSPRVWLLMLLLSLGAVGLHFSSKGISNFDALMMVGIFFAISMAIIIKEKQVLGAIIMHIINNTIAIFSLYNINFTNNPWLIWATIAIGGYLFINSRKIKILNRVLG